MTNITVPIQVNLPDDWIEQIVNRLRNDPESEWVEIVRCEYCEHWKNEHICECLSRYGTFETPKNFYCGYGKRRTDETD